MERREFLKVLPLSALAPKVVKEGVLSLELPTNSHLLFLVDETRVDFNQFLDTPGIMPPGSTGGAIIGTPGNPDEFIKIYRLDDGIKDRNP